MKPQTRRSPDDDWAVPLFVVIGAIMVGAACLFLLLYELCQPAINPNPGVAAYRAPPATRLVPLARASDAPELVDLPPEPPSALSALAQARPGDQATKREARPPRKRARVDPRERDYDQRKFGYVQQPDFGYHGWSNNRAFSGGPKSMVLTSLVLNLISLVSSSPSAPARMRAGSSLLTRASHAAALVRTPTQLCGRRFWPRRRKAPSPNAEAGLLNKYNEVDRSPLARATRLATCIARAHTVTPGGPAQVANCFRASAPTPPRSCDPLHKTVPGRLTAGPAPYAGYRTDE